MFFWFIALGTDEAPLCKKQRLGNDNDESAFEPGADPTSQDGEDDGSEPPDAGDANSTTEAEHDPGCEPSDEKRLARTKAVAVAEAKKDAAKEKKSKKEKDKKEKKSKNEKGTKNKKESKDDDDSKTHGGSKRKSSATDEKAQLAKAALGTKHLD